MSEILGFVHNWHRGGLGFVGLIAVVVLIVVLLVRPFGLFGSQDIERV